MTKARKLVIDSSVIVKWLNSQDEKYLGQADKILKDCEKKKVVLYAPELAKYEVGNAILNKGLDESLARICLTTLYSLPISFMPLSKKEAGESLGIASNSRITYYDAVFVALAKNIDATLVTDNPKHQTRTTGMKIISLKNYKLQTL